MSKVINILAVVDAERVLRDHVPAASGPTPLKNDGQGYVFMLTEWADTDQYQGTDIFAKVAEQDQEEGGYSLNVKAEAGDTVRWRLVSLTSPFQYRCYLYGLDPIGGWLHITEPQPKTSPVTYAAIDPAARSSDTLVTVQSHDFWWESQVTDNRRQAYNLLFAITDNASVQRGQFSSDPYIT